MRKTSGPIVSLAVLSLVIAVSVIPAAAQAPPQPAQQPPQQDRALAGPADVEAVMRELGYQVERKEKALVCHHETEPNIVVQFTQDCLLLISWWGFKDGVSEAQKLQACNRSNAAAFRCRFWIDQDGDLTVDRCMETGGVVSYLSFRNAVTLGNQEQMTLLARNFIDIIR